MTINTKTVLKNPEGEPYKDGEEVLTIGKAIVNTLATTKSTDPWKSYKLTNDFLKDSVDLKSDDVVFIKETFKEAVFFPYIVGQIFELLEGNAKEDK